MLHFDEISILLPCPSTDSKIVCAAFVSHQNLFRYCARPKDDLYLLNSILVPAQKFLEWHKMQFNFWSCTKYLDRPKTFWDLEKDKAEEHSDLGEHRVVFSENKNFLPSIKDKCYSK